MIPGLESVKKHPAWYGPGFPVCGLSAALFGHCERGFHPVRHQPTDIDGEDGLPTRWGHVFQREMNSVAFYCWPEKHDLTLKTGPATPAVGGAGRIANTIDSQHQKRLAVYWTAVRPARAAAEPEK